MVLAFKSAFEQALQLWRAMKAHKQYFPVVLCFTLYKVVLTFE